MTLTEDPALREKKSDYYKNRHLMTRAYRAARRAGNYAVKKKGRGNEASGHYVNALKLLEMGRDMKVKVGGINDAAATRLKLETEVAQEKSDSDNILKKYFGQGRPEQTQSTSGVAKKTYSSKPLSMSTSNPSDSYAGNSEYEDDYFKRLTLLA